MDFLFCRPNDELEWYFLPDHDEPQISASRIVELSREVFENISDMANKFTERQVCMGLSYLISSSASSCPYGYFDDSVSEKSRVQAIASMRVVFRDLFSRQCKQTVRYRDFPNGGAFTYAETCYMWWDIFPRHGVPTNPGIKPIDDAIVSTIGDILFIDNFACKESALHGLGHWALARSEDVELLIAQSLPSIPRALATYAAAARVGDVE
jgi:hypothetical protein